MKIVDYVFGFLPRVLLCSERAPAQGNYCEHPSLFNKGDGSMFAEGLLTAVDVRCQPYLLLRVCKD